MVRVGAGKAILSTEACTVCETLPRKSETLRANVYVAPGSRSVPEKVMAFALATSADASMALTCCMVVSSVAAGKVEPEIKECSRK